MEPEPPRHEPVAERLIREAMERGEFDDLPGAGKPLPGTGSRYDELWWVRSWMERNEIGAEDLSTRPNQKQRD